VKLNGQTGRVIAGIAVLVMLVLVGVLLIPPYIENFKLQRYLNDLDADEATARLPVDVIRTNVVNKAAALGLPVHGDDVRVTRSDDGALRIEVLYVVHVDMSVYSVDLHFRPGA
jgi:hypothetical protein